MKVLYFGIYSKGIEYPRNNNLMEGLRRNGIEVLEVHCELAGSFRQRMKVASHPLMGLVFTFNLIWSYAYLAWKFIRTPRVDAIIVGHPGYFHVHLGRILRALFNRPALLIYDVFIPFYDALVEDRGLFSNKGVAAKLLHRFEASCCRVADLCLIDTEENRQYLVNEFGLDPDRVKRLFVGATIREIEKEPPSGTEGTFTVLYVGTYIPLHGVDTILHAAAQFAENQDTSFLMVGSGQLKTKSVQLAEDLMLRNVEFVDWVPTDQLGDLIQSCDLVLGVFGTTEKTHRVIPSKVFDICAAGAPFITADTPAVREVFTHGENAFLIPAGNSNKLAGGIRYLKKNPELRHRIAQGAYDLAQTTFALDKIGMDLVKIIEEHSQGRRQQ